MLNNNLIQFFELNTISQNRSALMGIAILWVFLFHVGGLGIPYLDTLCKKGYLGVDIFFFLSGWGLCHSLSKDPNVTQFFKRRMLKIIPSWWIIIGLMAVVQMIMHLPHPESFIDFILYFSGLGYFVQGCFTDNTSIFVRFYEWYIPTLLLFYLFAPIFAKLSVRNNYVILTISIVAILCVSNYCILENFSLAYCRFPIYILGFIGYKLGTQNELTVNFVILFIVGIVLGLLWHLEVINVNIGFLVLLLILPFVLSIIPALKKKNPFNKLLSFFGTISLELYLLHIYNRLFKLIGIYIEERLLVVVITLLILSVMSYCINRFSTIIGYKLNNSL